MRGRMAVFEVLEMSSELEQVILDNPVDSKLLSVARSQGMLSLREDAMLKAFAGTIPFSEINTLSSLLLAGDDTGTQLEQDKTLTN
jgi:type IV pilus assembly protein PilB